MSLIHLRAGARNFDRGLAISSSFSHNFSYKENFIEVLAKLRKTVTPAKAVRLRLTELFELTGFPLSRE